MNKAAFIIFFLITGYTGLAQCDTKIILTSSTTEYLDSNNVVERSVPEKTIIHIDKSTISIKPGNNELKGAINENNCKWTLPYKEGNSVIRATLSDPGGNAKNATINIEGKDGKVFLTMQIAEMPGKTIRVSLDTFDEDK